MRNLDAWGIDKAAILAIDNGLLHGEGKSESKVKMIRNLPTKAPQGLKFTRAEVEDVLHGNAARLLKI